MATVNKAVLLGNLTRDPEIRFSVEGEAFGTLLIATSEAWRDRKTGEKREAVDYHRIAVHGRTAEIAGEYLRKGALVYVEGRLRTRKWQDRDGCDRYTTEVRCVVMKMLGRRHDQEPMAAAPEAGAPALKRAAKETAPAATGERGFDGGLC